MGFLGTYHTYDVLLKSKSMNPKTLFLVFLIVFLMLNSFRVFPVQANSDTLTLRPNPVGTYSQFVEVSNSGFVWGDQFESEDVTAWTSSTSATITSTVHTGSYAVDFTANTGKVYKDFTVSNTVYMRCYVRWSANPASGSGFYIILGARLAGGASTQIAARVDNVAGTIKWTLYYVNSTAKVVTKTFGSPNPTYNTWYCVELGWIRNTLHGAILYVDGTQLGTCDDTTNDYGLVNAWCGAVAGITGTNYYDDVVVSSSGPIGTENHPNLVNDSSDNTALQVTANTTQKETENLDDTNQTGPINSVTAYVRAKGTATTNQAVIVWRTYSTDYEGSTVNMTTSFTDYTDMKTTNPNTGAAWTWTEVNALDVGARASTLPSGTIQFSEFYIIVDYQSNVTPPTYSSISTDTTLANNPCSFNCLVSDDTNVSTYIFSTNNTGTWTNDSATTFSDFFNTTAAWANVTKTLNDTVGNVVSYLWYANDTNNNWSNSEQVNLTVRERPNIQITPDNVTCRKYLETFNVQINVTNAGDIQAFNFTIYYDPILLNCSSVTSGELARTFTVTFDTANGILEGKMAGSPINGNHWLLNITFQANERLIWKEGLANKLENKIWFHQAEIGFSDNSTLQYVEGGVNQINVNQMAYTFLPIQGDVNNDGTVNIQDIRTVAAYYGKTITDPEWPLASQYDLTGDNTIDVFDLVVVSTNFGFIYP